MADIEVRGYDRAPKQEDLRALQATTVFQVIDGVELTGEPTPLMGFFRFLRILSIEVRPDPSVPCLRCEEAADLDLRVEWEAGYSSRDGDCVCEHCLIGYVIKGAEKIDFGPDGVPLGNWSISTTMMFDES